MCRDGRLKVGDRVLEINGADATKVPLSEAYEMLAKSDTTVTLLVEYNISVIGLLESDSFSFLSFGQNRTISHHILTASKCNKNNSFSGPLFRTTRMSRCQRYAATCSLSFWALCSVHCVSKMATFYFLNNCCQKQINYLIY